uniref:Uncharacterized protein n=1 Tax=Davidia involucrata TaxID=16924 RepID=A0A5B7AJ26_DAVIN
MEKGKNIVTSNNVTCSGGYRMKNHEAIDRSKIRILLCDTNAESCEEVSTLLCECSYQVTSVWIATEVIGVLNSEGPHVDMILAEVGLLVADDAWMLKFIMGDKELQHIPVISKYISTSILGRAVKRTKLIKLNS